jgi:hypothetical protein
LAPRIEVPAERPALLAGASLQAVPAAHPPLAHFYERAALAFTSVRALNTVRLDVEEVVAEPEHVGERLVALAGAGTL